MDPEPAVIWLLYIMQTAWPMNYVHKSSGALLWAVALGSYFNAQRLFERSRPQAPCDRQARMACAGWATARGLEWAMVPRRRGKARGLPPQDRLPARVADGRRLPDVGTADASHMTD